jgi:hypothetical protein
MKYYDVYKCDVNPSVYAMYKTADHETILAKSPIEARKIYAATHSESNGYPFLRASFICNK